MSVRMILLSVTISLTLVEFCHGMCNQISTGGKLKCCDGKDSKCFVKIQNLRGHTTSICYCDPYCKFTNDCCEDFEKTQRLCRDVRDCKVNQWSEWGECSKTCGFGVMDRKRTVLESPKNGGKACPPLKQTRGCNLNTICNENKYDTAVILPIAYRRPIFGKWGYENILPAIKLKEQDEESYKNRINSKYSYCVHYKFTSKSRACKGTWIDQMIDSVPICTECQSRVMDDGHCKGEGAVSIKTRWTALTLQRCYGDWIRLGPIIPNCSCSDENFSNFVFV